MDQNFARNRLVPLSVLFSRQNKLLPDNFSENLKILEIFLIGPHALPQCNGDGDLKWTKKKIIPFEFVFEICKHDLPFGTTLVLQSVFVRWSTGKDVVATMSVIVCNMQYESKQRSARVLMESRYQHFLPSPDWSQY